MNAMRDDLVLPNLPTPPKDPVVILVEMLEKRYKLQLRGQALLHQPKL